MDLFRWMGVSTSHQTSSSIPKGVKTGGVKPINHADYKQFGFENFGNTCYANAVLQALYFCQPFRELVCDSHDKSNPPIAPALLASPTPAPIPALSSSPSRAPALKAFRRRDSAIDTSKSTDDVLPNGNASGAPGRPSSSSAQAAPPIPPSPPTLFSALRSLFLHIALNPGDKGTISPTSFINKLKKENELYRSSMHQDAHEFLNFLLNKIVEDLEAELSKSVELGEDLSNSIGSLPTPTVASSSTGSPSHSNSSDSRGQQHTQTFVHSLFEGTLTSETRCLTCETVSSRDESFLDLSIDIEQNSSVTACLRQFSASEMLSHKNKFFCDSCGGLQEAEKRMKIKKLPNVLALHLKRFKYQEDVQKYIKLAYRVAFPLELRLFNTVDDADDPDRLYQLFAIVVHIGGGPHHGHYIAIVKAHGSWFVFDDDNVDPIREADIPKYFGESPGGAGYVLFYQAVDLDLASVGIDPTPTSATDAGEVGPDAEVESSGDSASEPIAPITPASKSESIPTSPTNLKLEIPVVVEPSEPSAVPTITPSVPPPPIVPPTPTAAASAPTAAVPVTTSAAVPSSGSGGFFSLGRTLKHSQSVKIGDKKRISSYGAAELDSLPSRSPTVSGSSGNGDAVPPPAPEAVPAPVQSSLTHSKSFRGKDRDSATGWFTSRKKEKKDKRVPVPVPVVPNQNGLAQDDIGLPSKTEHSTSTLEARRPSAPTILEYGIPPLRDRRPASSNGEESPTPLRTSMTTAHRPSALSSLVITPPPPPPTSFPLESPSIATTPIPGSKLARPTSSPSSLSSPSLPLPPLDPPPPVPSLPMTPSSPRLRKASLVMPVIKHPAPPTPDVRPSRPSTAGAKPKRASRKMSLSSLPGMLGSFGRRDKDKDKDRGEKDKESAPSVGMAPPVPPPRNPARSAMVGRSQSAVATLSSENA